MATTWKSESSSDVGPPPKPWQSYHTVFTNAKAGMEGVDKEKVQRTVYEMSKGSKYFENEERKEAFMRQKIENMRARCSSLSAADVSHYQKVAEKRIIELEAQRDLSRIWLHVDMDAFYAAVETLSNPSLKGKPMAVGGMSMISTANYEARKYGVRAAMPGFIARKLCPELVFVPTDFKKYTYYSNLTRKVFERYDPNFIAASLDEAYLDITEVCRERGLNNSDIAEELRRSVFEETGLTCSAGVGPNRLLAKVCSDINKPNGQYILPNDRIAVMTFISSLPIRKIGGIGKVTEHILKDAFGINTCEDILEKGGLLCALFSRSSADFFLSVGLGMGSTEAPQARQRKSMSNERTFSATNDETFLYDKIGELAEMLASDLQKEGLRGRTLTLKLKTASFEVRTRATTLHKYICSCADILLHARKLLKAELPLSVRLIGLRVSQFSEERIGPSDPTQKSITNFVKLRDASRSNLYCSDSADVNTGNNTSTAHTDDHSSCNHITVNADNDIFDSDQLSDFGYSNFGINENAANSDLYQNYDPSDNIQSEASATEIVRKDQLIVNASSGKDADEATSCANLSNYAAISSSYVQVRWVDDYKCSLCGAEVPPELIDERLEHSDFHFAERLQRECCDTSLSIDSWKLRDTQTQNDAKQVQNRRKKHKSSPEQGKYVSIEKFFMKKSHNA